MTITSPIKPHLHTIIFKPKGDFPTRIGGRMREPFDASRDFTLIRPSRINGIEVKGGDKIDKKLLTTRRLRQMYDNRMLRMLPADPAIAEAQAKAAAERRAVRSSFQLGPPLQNFNAPGTENTSAQVPVQSEPKTEPMKPVFEDLNPEELRRWLGIHNVVPRPRTTQAKLLEMAEAKWQELLTDIPGGVA